MIEQDQVALPVDGEFEETGGEMPPDQPTEGVDEDKIAATFKARVESTKQQRQTFFHEWKRNVEMRLGKPAALFTGGSGDEEAQTEINPDWSLTKTKTANLFSQVPTVQLTHENKAFEKAVPPFAKALNYEIGEKRANLAVPMEESLNDAVNASGIAATYVGYDARFEDKQVPAIDLSTIPPEVQQQLIATGQIPMTTVPQVVSDLFYASRLSPTKLLIPADFVGSHFDDADFVGRSDGMPTAMAQHEFKLTPEQLEQTASSEENHDKQTLKVDKTNDGKADTKMVYFEEIFYWRYRVDPEEKHFKCIYRIVWVHGIDKPVIHEPWKGQRKNEQTGRYIGATRFPIQVLTLTYISDNSIPPSDSAAGRPQVNDMRRSRSQMFANRERSIPIRWYDVNRIDPLIQELLRQGTWQGMIPTNGDGSRSIGEIARASYPSEDNTFDQAAKGDLMEAWQIGPNQQGVQQGGRRTGTEANIIQSNFATRIGQERARTASYFLRICEVLSGLMILYSDFPSLTPEERQVMEETWDKKTILHDLVFKIRPDSAIVLDTASRLERLQNFLNMTVKSGYINPKPIIVEMAELSGIDPNDVVIDPQPKEPDDPNISYRFSGKDDLMNPLVVALLVKNGKAPSPQDLDAAIKMLTVVQQGTPTPPPTTAGAPGAPSGPTPPGPGGADSHPDWQIASKVAQRSEDL